MKLFSVVTSTACRLYLNERFSASAPLTAILASGVLLAGCGKPEQSAQESAPKLATIDYAGLDFTKLSEAQQAALEAAKGMPDDEGAILKAWAGVLKDLLNIRSEVQRTGKILAEADLLNISKITNGTPNQISEQFVERRKIANANWSALNDWENALHGISGRYYAGLIERSVSQQRIATEVKKLQQDLIDKVKAEANICEAEKKVPQEYNYAVNAMQNYYTYKMARVPNQTQPPYVVTTKPLPWEVKNTPDPAVTDSAQKFQREIATVEQFKKDALQARQEPSVPN